MNSIESEAKEDSGRVANNCCVFAWWHWPTKSERNGHRMGTLMVKFGRRHLEANLEERESGQKKLVVGQTTAKRAPLAICSLKATKRTSPMARGACHQ